MKKCKCQSFRNKAVESGYTYLTYAHTCQSKMLVWIIFHALPGRNLLLPKENSLSGPSNGHSSQHVQPQAVDMEGIEINGAEHKCTKY